MNTNILSFDEFSKTNESTETEVNERVEIFALSRLSTSKEDFRNKLVQQLKKEAPLLASDEDFVNNIVDTYQEDETEAAK